MRDGTASDETDTHLIVESGVAGVWHRLPRGLAILLLTLSIWLTIAGLAWLLGAAWFAVNRAVFG